MSRSGETIVIPLNATQGCVVEIHPEQLPNNPEDILDLLTGEAVPFSVWWDVARVYLQQNRVDQCLHILFEAITPETNEEVKRFFGKEPTYEQVLFNCGLASILIAKGKEEKDLPRKQDNFNKAATYLTQAKNIDAKEQLPYIGAGLLALAKVLQQLAHFCFQLTMFQVVFG